MSQTKEIVLNGQKVPFVQPQNLAELLKQFRIQASHLAIVVNNEIVPVSERGKWRIEPGDVIEVLRAVQGG